MTALTAIGRGRGTERRTSEGILSAGGLTGEKKSMAGGTSGGTGRRIEAIRREREDMKAGMGAAVIVNKNRGAKGTEGKEEARMTPKPVKKMKNWMMQLHKTAGESTDV